MLRGDLGPLGHVDAAGAAEIPCEKRVVRGDIGRGHRASFRLQAVGTGRVRPGKAEVGTRREGHGRHGLTAELADDSR